MNEGHAAMSLLQLSPSSDSFRKAAGDPEIPLQVTCTTFLQSYESQQLEKTKAFLETCTALQVLKSYVAAWIIRLMQTTRPTAMTAQKPLSVTCWVKLLIKKTLNALVAARLLFLKGHSAQHDSQQEPNPPSIRIVHACTLAKWHPMNLRVSKETWEGVGRGVVQATLATNLRGSVAQPLSMVLLQVRSPWRMLAACRYSRACAMSKAVARTIWKLGAPSSSDRSVLNHPLNKASCSPLLSQQGHLGFATVLCNIHTQDHLETGRTIQQ